MMELPIARSGVARQAVRSSYYNHFVENGSSTYIFNSLSGALAELDVKLATDLNRLKTGEQVDFDEETREALLESNFLVPEALDEFAHVRELHLQSRYSTSAYMLTICPTIACNFACDYCFEVHRPGKMKKPVQDAVVDLLESKIKHLENFHVTWFGGEPTLAWDVIEDLTARFQELCHANQVIYSADIITNGFLLGSDRISQLESLNIERVQITLDGDADVHDTRRVLHSGKGTFARILNNLKLFHLTKSHASIRVNVDGRNKGGVHDLINRLADAGLNTLPNVSMYFASVDATTEPSHGVEQFCLTRSGFANVEPDYYRHAAAVGLASVPYPAENLGSCIAVRPEQYVIQADGELHKCWNTVGQSQFAVGNILEKDVDPRRHPAYLKWMSWSPFKEAGACSKCTWLPSCTGGCPFTVVYSDMTPSGKIELECTSFKFNSDQLLPLYLEFAERPSRS